MIRQARIVIRQISVECPHCGMSVMTPESKDAHTFELFVDPGRTTCRNCRGLFEIPNLSTAFRRMRV